MSEGLDQSRPTGTQRMHRSVVDLAERAVATKQITFEDAAIGSMFAAYSLYRVEMGEEASLATMRAAIEIMAKDLKAQREAPLL